MSLKHQEEVAKFADCDLENFQVCDREPVYRWVFEDINDWRNFEAPYVRDTQRKRDTCKGWALSFYTTKDSARERLLHLAGDKEKVFKKLGTHTAEGSLAKEDGISGNANHHNHFDHFAYEGVILNTKYSIVEKIAS